MSDSDKARLRKSQPVTVLVQENDAWGDYEFEVTTNKRHATRVERTRKREMAQAGAGRKQRVADLLFQEQMREAMMQPAYVGPVGTRMAEWERELLYPHTCTVNCLCSANEVRLSTCEYGCKVYATPCGELIFHSTVYGHSTYSIERVFHVEPIDYPLHHGSSVGGRMERALTKIEPVVSKKRALTSRAREWDEAERALSSARALGFGG